MLHRWLIILIFMLVSGQSFAQTNDDLAPTYSNLSYTLVDSARQRLDVYLPDDAPQPYPVIFMVHGGGYLFGNKADVAPVAQHFTDLGFAVIAPNYRLAPQATFPAQLQDLFCALGWVYDQASDYSLDLTQLILMGESAGAHGVSLLATVNDPERFSMTNCDYAVPEGNRGTGVVLYYPPVDLSTCECPLAKQMAGVVLGIDRDTIADDETELRDLWDQATPLAWLDGTEAPFLIIHGTADRIIDISESEYLRDVLVKAGISVQFEPIIDADHGFFAHTWKPEMYEALAITTSVMTDWLTVTTNSR